MKYQIAELTRLKQISCEIFIQEGMDAALNIDREGFNFAHPHYHIVATWLHGAIRQLTNQHKIITRSLRNELAERSRADSLSEEERALAAIVDEALSFAHKFQLGPSDSVKVTLLDSEDAAKPARKKGEIALPRNELVGVHDADPIQTESFLMRLVGVVRILSGFGLLESLSIKQQVSLFKFIARIMQLRQKK